MRILYLDQKIPMFLILCEETVRLFSSLSQLKERKTVKSNSIFKLFISLILVFVANLAQAFTLQEYISKQCPKHCVNADVLTDTVQRAATSHRVNPKILLAIIEVESSFSTRAKNNGSLGIAQIYVRYHRDKFAGKDFFNVEQNIFAGAEILSDCLRQHKGSYQRALACYNGAPIKSTVYSSKVFKTVKRQSTAQSRKVEDPIYRFLVEQKLLD